MLDGKEVFVRASIGIAVAEARRARSPTAREELLRNADVAMYMAKENGKGRYQVFEPAMHDTALKRLELKADLQRALEHGEFVLHYQPVIELESGRISGVEALIRWKHPERGMVPPLDFIPLAEETGLIVPIGQWVLQEACRTRRSCRRGIPSDPPLHMAVNLSARQLQRPEIVDEVARDPDRDGPRAASLILEITESVMMQDMELSIERLRELKALGVQLAIDDFGTGYSSLNYIRRFPVDILKVDKSFIDGVDRRRRSLGADRRDHRARAGSSNLKPVAEGIERADQLERLLELHCDLGQGYFFAKPLTARRSGRCSPSASRCRPRSTPSPTAPSSTGPPILRPGRYHRRIVRPLSRRPRHVSIVVALTLALLVVSGGPSSARVPERLGGTPRWIDADRPPGGRPPDVGDRSGDDGTLPVPTSGVGAARPASNQKLLLSMALFDRLGPSLTRRRS